MKKVEEIERIDLEQRKYISAIVTELMSNNDLFAKNIFKTNYISHYGQSLDVYLFFKTNFELNRNTLNGNVEKMKSLIISMLKDRGYFNLFASEIRFDFDSDENIQKKFKGNYFFKYR